jgi:hypothetical protein
MSIDQRTDEPQSRANLSRGSLAQLITGITMLVIGFGFVLLVIAGI